jgi:nitroimidazol reductase NimA-like FMN-containing flavoprotein (pyridoxamine 5'-phosphate oxidase superfamily)
MPSRRGKISLTDEEIEKYMEDGWTLQVASNGKDGFPHMVAMWYIVLDGKICFTTFRKSQKILNLQRDPKISVMLEAGEKYQELTGLVIETEADVVDEPDFTAKVMGLVGSKYNGIPAPTETSEQAMKVASKRVVVSIDTSNNFSWDHRKLGGVY